MSSAECLAMIEKYKSVIQQIGGLYDYLSTCNGLVEQCNSTMKDTQISGETMDHGKLEEISNAITTLRSAFDTIIAECQIKIEEYTALYYEALERERLAAEEAAKNANTN